MLKWTDFESPGVHFFLMLRVCNEIIYLVLPIHAIPPEISYLRTVRRFTAGNHRRDFSATARKRQMGLRFFKVKFIQNRAELSVIHRAKCERADPTT